MATHCVLLKRDAYSLYSLLELLVSVHFLRLERTPQGCRLQGLLSSAHLLLLHFHKSLFAYHEFFFVVVVAPCKLRPLFEST